MSLYRMVNGEEIALSAEEEAEVGAEWAANEEISRAQAATKVGRQNVTVTTNRTRADALAAIERKVAAGAPQCEINLDLLNHLKEQP